MYRSVEKNRFIIPLHSVWNASVDRGCIPMVCEDGGEHLFLLRRHCEYQNVNTGRAEIECGKSAGRAKHKKKGYLAGIRLKCNLFG